MSSDTAWVIGALGGELVGILLVMLWVVYCPKNDARRRLIPEGWKIKRRGFLGLAGYDARDPEGKWLGWTYTRKSWAVDHAWDVARFERAIARQNEELERIKSRHPWFTEGGSSSSTRPSAGSISEAGDGNESSASSEK